MSMTPKPKEINIILNILKGAQFEFLPRAPFYIDTPLTVTSINFYRNKRRHIPVNSNPKKCKSDLKGKIAENILNKQSRAADKGWFSRLGVGHGATNSSP
jgi:hypothetical protein